MEAHPEANWWTIAYTVGGALAVIVYGFVSEYRRRRVEPREAGEVVGKSVGAAFVDRESARDLRSIAEDTKVIRQIAEAEEGRFKESELLKKMRRELKERGEEGG